MFSLRDFILVSIRTGIGSSIIVDGHLYKGHQNLAGGLAHFTVDPNGPVCRCGKRGCLETYINQDILFQKLLELTHDSGEYYSIQDTKERLGELFTLARNGNDEAIEFIRDAVTIFAPKLAELIMVLNIRDVIVSGHFGRDGDFFVKLLDEAIRPYVLPKAEYELRYYPFDDTGFVRGAALLILQDYFSDAL